MIADFITVLKKKSVLNIVHKISCLQRICVLWIIFDIVGYNGEMMGMGE